VRIAVTGSAVTDHLMVFPGRSVERLPSDRPAHIPLAGIGIESLGKKGLRCERAGQVPLTSLGHRIPPESAVRPGHTLAPVPGARS
jgi:hypothetical protein